MRCLICGTPLKNPPKTDKGDRRCRGCRDYDMPHVIAARPELFPQFRKVLWIKGRPQCLFQWKGDECDT